MQIEILGSGPLVEYAVNGTVIAIGGEGGIEIDCAAIQTDGAVVVDICCDSAGNLVQGISEGRSYVASLTIPPQEKSEQPKTEDGEPVLDDNGNQVYEVVVAPLNMNKVRLALWPTVNSSPVSEGKI